MKPIISIGAETKHIIEAGIAEVLLTRSLIDGSVMAVIPAFKITCKAVSVEDALAKLEETLQKTERT